MNCARVAVVALEAVRGSTRSALFCLHRIFDRYLALRVLLYNTRKKPRLSFARALYGGYCERNWRHPREIKYMFPLLKGVSVQDISSLGVFFLLQLFALHSAMVGSLFLVLLFEI